MNRIILIGNGFDLAHELKTSYKDFIDWFWRRQSDKIAEKNSCVYSDVYFRIELPKGKLFSEYWKPLSGSIKDYDSLKEYMYYVQSLFSEVVLHYKTVFGHFRKWCKDGSWKQAWMNLLCDNKSYLDLSSASIGSHTTALRGGEEVAYQGRKKRKTTNALYLADSQGLPLAMSSPIAGNHHDLYQIKVSLPELFEPLNKARISLDGLFVNADSGFDFTVSSWEAFNYIAFIVILLKKIKQTKKSR